LLPDARRSISPVIATTGPAMLRAAAQPSTSVPIVTAAKISSSVIALAQNWVSTSSIEIPVPNTQPQGAKARE
jgi:hypothetical protein